MTKVKVIKKILYNMIGEHRIVIVNNQLFVYFNYDSTNFFKMVDIKNRILKVLPNVLVYITHS
jgi:hypothetical protein